MYDMFHGWNGESRAAFIVCYELDKINGKIMRSLNNFIYETKCKQEYWGFKIKEGVYD